MKLRRFLDMVAAYALVVLLIVIAIKLTRGTAPVFEGRAYVIDGDTLALGSERLRLVGIDAPELGQSCEAGGIAVPCGRRAREALRALVTAGVRCEGHGRDVYHRVLATCTAGAGDLGARMVADGQAVADGCCWAEEAAARRARRGIWAGAFERPAAWRRARRMHESVAQEP
ncbi:thermonuclease family protein [Labrys wisconsinensis]|uniref:Endonuclease YncB(Thermonuclease family) n=1 Tax=Labrys wisconsinensis TaxID=425677 RepID=A0ABU0J9S7_9HYPH|nr:thermonuclease family protein [Labrys wisconsinensis]MDQ0471019.1 endonuclease YncB(thermonuclease family) [Labrys wisconsinensis]